MDSKKIVTKHENDNVSIICDETYTWRDSLLRHNRQFRSSSGERKYVLLEQATEAKAKIFDVSTNCTICEITFTRKDSLKRHIQQFHSSIPSKNVDCQICGKSFSKASNLRAHQSTQHIISGRKLKSRAPQKCDVCHKIFSRTDVMIKHKSRKHNDSKDHKCNVCEKSFHDKSNLSNHNRLMHQYQKASRTERNFICHLCDRNYKSYAGLYFHNNVRHKKSTRCNICGKGFAKPLDLKKHFQDYHIQDPLDLSLVPIKKEDPDPLEIKQEPTEIEFVIKKEEI